MSKQNQCDMCRRRCYKCSFYDPKVDEYCQHFQMPVDNTKMFSHFLSTQGRIGRLEYVLTVLIALVLGTITTTIGFYVVVDRGEEILNSWLFNAIVLAPTMYLLIVSGEKRAHDSGAPVWFSLAPLFLIYNINIFTLVFALIGTFFLLKDPSEDSINEYGTIPNQAYDPQIQAQYSEE